MTEELDKYILDVDYDCETGEEHCTVLKTDGTTHMLNWIEIVSVMYIHHSVFEPLIKELNNLSEENEQLKKENQMLKHTIGRNENYITRLTHKGEWKNTTKPLYRSISRGD